MISAHLPERQISLRKLEPVLLEWFSYSWTLKSKIKDWNLSTIEKADYRVGSSAVIFGLGFSTIISTYLLDIWEIQPQKAAAIVLGIAIPLSLLFFYGIKKTLLSVQGRKLAASLPSLFGILLVCSGLLVSFIGLPSGKTPDSRQFIEIKPATNRSDSVPSIILVEEIKIDEKPVPLESIKPSSGWLTTDFGLQMKPGVKIPLF